MSIKSLYYEGSKSTFPLTKNMFSAKTCTQHLVQLTDLHRQENVKDASY